MPSAPSSAELESGASVGAAEQPVPTAFPFASTEPGVVVVVGVGSGARVATTHDFSDVAESRPLGSS